MNNYYRFTNFAIFTLLMPFVYGCVGGPGSLATLLGGTGGAVGAGAGGGSLAFSGGGAGGGAAIAAIQNPEPATMALMGGGMMAMAYFRHRKKH